MDRDWPAKNGFRIVLVFSLPGTSGSPLIAAGYALEQGLQGCVETDLVSTMALKDALSAEE